MAGLLPSRCNRLVMISPAMLTQRTQAVLIRHFFEIVEINVGGSLGDGDEATAFNTRRDIQISVAPMPLGRLLSNNSVRPSAMSQNDWKSSRGLPSGGP